MAGMIDQTTGEAGFYMHQKFEGDAPWHLLGQWHGEAQFAAQAIKLSHGDYNVLQTPVLANVGDGLITIEVPGKFVNYRDDTLAPLGIVGSAYVPTQNIDGFNWVEEISGEATFESAGSLDGGKRFFVSANLNRELLLAGGEDKADLYLVFYNSHDGSMPNVGYITTVRPVCHNTVTYGLRSAQSKVVRKHTVNGMRSMTADARGILGMVDVYAEAYQKEAETLLAADLTTGGFIHLADKVFGLDSDSKTGKARQENIREKLVWLWNDGNGTIGGIGGTVWAAEQAMTEYVDWFAPVNGTSELSDAAVRVVRAERAMMGGSNSTAAIKFKIHEAARELVSA